MNWWYLAFILIGCATVSYLSEIAEKLAHVIRILEEKIPERPERRNWESEQGR